MRFLLVLLCVVLLGVVSAAPTKVSLPSQFMSLPSQTQMQPTMFAQPAPVKSLAMQTLPAETLPAQQGETLETRNLPVIRGETSETLPQQTLAPLKATYLQPNYRRQEIQQEVIQPIYQTQPVLQVRHVTQNVYQPTLQKQPVIQRVITQPVLHRVIHNQPIIQQQLQMQNVVKRRVINQPRVIQRLQTMYQTAPTQTQTQFGEAYPSQTVPNAKIARLSSSSNEAAGSMSFADAAAAAPAATAGDDMNGAEAGADAE